LPTTVARVCRHAQRDTNIPAAVYRALIQIADDARRHDKPEFRMDLQEIILRFSRVILQAAAAILGSLSIVFLWISFYEASAAAYAIFCLGTAAGITLFLPGPPPARRHRRP
jgi:hypothetical protein